jgi:4-amino-4-deoxy-L-arabinose transferase-like glycosyltransferase
MSHLRNPLLLVLIFSLPFFMVCVGNLALSDDDAMYPEIAREMRQTNDWVTPRLNGALHFDKPPLVYWLTGLSQYILGETDAAARLWPVLTGWATVLVIGCLGASLYGRRAGWLSALVLAACLGPYLYTRVVSTDSILCFFCALAILSYTRAMVIKSRHTGAWLLLMFVSLGLAGLTKGVLGMGLPAFIIFLHALLCGQLKSFFSWRAALGIVVMFTIWAPWHLLMAKANPGFLWHFFVREHLLRFTGQRYPRDEFLSAPAFLGFTLLWVFPWIGVLPQAIAGAVRRIRETGRTKGQDLLPCLWCLVVIGLFTASRCRMEYYSIPAIPAFALLIGKLWDEVLQGDSRISTRLMSGALFFMSAILLLAAVVSWEVLGPSKEAIFRLFAVWWPGSGWSGAAEQVAALERIRVPTLIVLTGSALFILCASYAMRVSRPGLACGLLAGIMAPIFLMAHWGFVLMEPFMSSRPVVEILERAEPVEAVIIQEPHEYQAISGMVYYSQKTVYILENSAVVNPALRHRDIAAKFLTREELGELWKSGKRLAFVFDHSVQSEAAELARFGPMDVIGRFGDRVIVANATNQGPAQKQRYADSDMQMDRISSK